jgi:hypothetical protein
VEELDLDRKKTCGHNQDGVSMLAREVGELELSDVCGAGEILWLGHPNTILGFFG